MPLPREPQRRTEAQRRRHLDAHEVALERALLARAGMLESVAHAVENNVEGLEPGETSQIAETRRTLAIEFRALAAELHHW